METTTRQTLKNAYEQISNATANLLSIYDRIAYGDGLKNNIVMAELKIRELIKVGE